MCGRSRNVLGKILAFAAVVEIGTGLALIIDPAIVVALLLGANSSGGGTPIGRFLGIALLALGAACWPGRQRTESDSPALRGMLIYNPLVVLLLAYLGVVEHQAGVLLWPAVALHAVVPLLLAWTWRAQRGTKVCG